MADLSIHSIIDAFRLYPKKNHGNKNLRSNKTSQTIKKVPNILVKFCGPRPIEKLFSKMGTIRETFKDAQLEVLCPLLLLPHPSFFRGVKFEVGWNFEHSLGGQRGPPWDPQKPKKKIFHGEIFTPYFHWDLNPGPLVEVENQGEEKILSFSSSFL